MQHSMQHVRDSHRGSFSLTRPPWRSSDLCSLAKESSREMHQLLRQPVVCTASLVWPLTVQSLYRSLATCLHLWENDKQKDKPFHWSEHQERSFQRIKELLTSAKVMAYFDPSKETELIIDASPSAILMQKTSASDDRRVVAYVNRTLSPVERRYSQIEKARGSCHRLGNWEATHLSVWKPLQAHIRL